MPPPIRFTLTLEAPENADLTELQAQMTRETGKRMSVAATVRAAIKEALRRRVAPEEIGPLAS